MQVNPTQSPSIFLPDSQGKPSTKCTASKVLEVALRVLSGLIYGALIAAGTMAFIGMFPLSAAVAITAVIVGALGLAGIATVEIVMAKCQGSTAKPKPTPKPTLENTATKTTTVTPPQSIPAKTADLSTKAIIEIKPGEKPLDATKPAIASNAPAKAVKEETALQTPNVKPGLAPIAEETVPQQSNAKPDVAPNAGTKTEPAKVVKEEATPQQPNVKPDVASIASEAATTVAKPAVSVATGTKVEDTSAKPASVKPTLVAIVADATNAVATNATKGTAAVVAATPRKPAVKKVLTANPDQTKDAQKLMAILNECTKCNDAIEKALTTLHFEDMTKTVSEGEEMLRNMNVERAVLKKIPQQERDLDAKIKEAKALMQLFDDVESTHEELQKAIKDEEWAKVFEIVDIYDAFLDQMDPVRFAPAVGKEIGNTLVDGKQLVEQLMIICKIMQQQVSEEPFDAEATRTELAEVKHESLTKIKTTLNKWLDSLKAGVVPSAPEAPSPSELKPIAVSSGGSAFDSQAFQKAVLKHVDTSSVPSPVQSGIGGVLNNAILAYGRRLGNRQNSGKLQRTLTDSWNE